MTAYTHVSVSANDLDESVAFYRDVIGMEHIPSPTFEQAETEWMRCGNLQLHLFFIDGLEAPDVHHFGVHLENFDEVYRQVREEGLFDEMLLDSPPQIYELPDGAVQTYIRDPAGNLVELNYHDVDALADDVASDVSVQDVPQTGEATEAELYMVSPEDL